MSTYIFINSIKSLIKSIGLKISMILSIFCRLDPVFNMGSRDSQSWMFKFCNAIKKVAHNDELMTMSIIVMMRIMMMMMTMILTDLVSGSFLQAQPRPATTLKLFSPHIQGNFQLSLSGIAFTFRKIMNF